MPILADGVVRFIGEKVPAVAADSEAIAEQALELIDVEYEEMEPLLDPLQAIEPHAPLLHPQVSGYRGLLHPIENSEQRFCRHELEERGCRSGLLRVRYRRRKRNARAH
jgi:CO/xanthine dehydrogenase Mo-binding subunit